METLRIERGPMQVDNIKTIELLFDKFTAGFGYKYLIMISAKEKVEIQIDIKTLREGVKNAIVKDEAEQAQFIAKHGGNNGGK
jgi:hypothetical protein